MNQGSASLCIVIETANTPIHNNFSFVVSLIRMMNRDTAVIKIPDSKRNE